MGDMLIFEKGPLTEMRINSGVGRLTCDGAWITSSPPKRKCALSGGVAQMVRALACHARGRGFKSRHSRHFSLDCDLLEWSSQPPDILGGRLDPSHGLTAFSKAG
jgi:hypothetical protein